MSLADAVALNLGDKMSATLERASRSGTVLKAFDSPSGGVATFPVGMFAALRGNLNSFLTPATSSAAVSADGAGGGGSATGST